jgi:hypothetical protein
VTVVTTAIRVSPGSSTRAPALDRFDRFFQPDPRFPAAVTVTRTSEADFKSRQLVASIDGRPAATLLWGDSITCELDPGAHRLRVHNTLVWKTVDFALAPGEQLFFEVINRTGPGTLAMTVLFGIGPLYVTIRRM